MDAPTLSWTRDADGSIIPTGPGISLAPPRGASLTARATALSKLLPDEAVVARRAAAWIWGLDVLPPGVNEADWDIELLTPNPPENTAITADHVDLPSDHVREKAGVRLTSPPRTALDCARWLPRAEAVAALDQFLRLGVKTAELTAMARGLPGYRSNKRLREILRIGDPGAASPGESWTRAELMRVGFPRPHTQIPVPGPLGRWLYIDLGYPDFRVGMEYDGERHHTGPSARAHDHRRRRWLAKEQGWEIIPVTKDFLSRPGPYLEALLTALQAHGWKPADTTMEKIAAHLTTHSRRR